MMTFQGKSHRIRSDVFYPDFQNFYNQYSVYLFFPLGLCPVIPASTD